MEIQDLWKHYASTPDQSHGVGHIKGVLHNARLIGKAYPEVNPDDIEAAALLHDITREDDFVNGTDDHHISGVNAAKPYIQHLDDARKHAILDAVANHRSSGVPSTDLGRIISDADRLDSVHRIPGRSVSYFRSTGLDSDTALRRSYWTLRHHKLNTLGGRAKNFHTEEGRNIYKGQVATLEQSTRTFQDFLKYIPEADGNMEFKKEAAEITGYHYTKEGKPPENILNYSPEKQKEIMRSMNKDGFTRGTKYLSVRSHMERALKTVADEKLPKLNKVDHPLYFRVGKDPMGWNDGYTGYKIDPKLLQKATYTIGDSFDYLRDYSSDKGAPSLPGILRDNVLTHKELKKMTPAELKDHPNLAERKGGNYIEGQIWTPFKVEGKTIVEDKEMQKKAELHEDLSVPKASAPAGNGSPAGTVSPEPIGDVAKTDVKNKLLPVGAAADAVQGHDPKTAAVSPHLVQRAKLVGGAGVAVAAMQGLDYAKNDMASLSDQIPTRGPLEELPKYAAFMSKYASFRDDYKLPSADPNDPRKLENYRETNEKLLKEHKWSPAIREHLEKEIGYAKEHGQEIKAEQDALNQQNALNNKTIEIGNKQQEAAIKNESSVTRANVIKTYAEAGKAKKEGDAAIISAHNSGKPAAKPASKSVASKPAKKADKPKPKVKSKEKTAAFEAQAKNILSRAANFVKDVGGRGSELQHLNKQQGVHEALANQFPKGSFHQQVNAQCAENIKNKITQTNLHVRKARVDTAIGGAVGAGVYSEYGNSEPKYASDGTTTVVLDRKNGYSADVLHALETFGEGHSSAKAKLIASAAVAAGAAGMAAYGASRLDPALAAHTMHTKAGVELGKAVGEMLPLIGATGGAYYAWRNPDNKTKRMAGMAVSALSGVALAPQLLNNKVDMNVTPEMVREGLPFSVGSMALGGSLAYGSHVAQDIADKEVIDNAMSSSAPIHEVTAIVNNIREAKNVETRYPLMRYVLPGRVKQMVNRTFGRPAGKMTGEDMAFYFNTQVEHEYQKLLKQYEATSGHPSQGAMTDLKNMAHDNVSMRVTI